MLDLLDSTVMPYPWGSRTAIASLQTRPSPSEGPEAELWMGAHPLAPSRLERDGVRLSLEEVIAASPERELGARSLDAFGPRLPFLLKVLAAAEPLSLQAHPTAERARAGFEDEERRGLPRTAADRNYKDPFHKPELLCALGPFVALSGFRAIPETLRLFDALGVTSLEETLRPLRTTRDAAGLAATFRTLMTLPEAERLRIVGDVVTACRSTGPFAEERRWAVRLAELYPGDAGVVSALLLQLVRLEAGEAIYLGAGNLHAYLEGTGVEIMASSDNVLRGGLTKKHVDVSELIAVLDFGGGPAEVRRPEPVDEDELVYETPAAEFRLSRIALAGKTVARTPSGPEILLATEGEARVAAGGGATHLRQGGAVFVPANAGTYRLEGSGTVFRATTNL